MLAVWIREKPAAWFEWSIAKKMAKKSPAVRGFDLAGGYLELVSNLETNYLTRVTVATV